MGVWTRLRVARSSKMKSTNSQIDIINFIDSTVPKRPHETREKVCYPQLLWRPQMENVNYSSRNGKGWTELFQDWDDEDLKWLANDTRRV